MSYSDRPARQATYGDIGADEGAIIAITTILDRLSRREPWEVLVWHRAGESSTTQGVAPDAPHTGRTTTVQDVRMALLAGVPDDKRDQLQHEYAPNARATRG